MNKTTQKTLFSSNSSEWSTPQDFFNKLDWRFGKFTLDPCATYENHKTLNKQRLYSEWIKE